MQTVLTIYGTRPEAVKISAYHDALRAAGLTSLLISTGQQPDLLRQSPLYGATCLNMPATGSPLDYAQSLINPLCELLRNESIDAVTVQGDTASAYAGALAAAAQTLPLIHLEAGVRTGDLNNPYPEEFFRREIDSMADWYFCATDANLQNLVNEGLDGHAWVTGNTGIDTLYQRVQPVAPDLRARRVLITLHRRESHGAIMREIVEGILLACQRYPGTEFLWPLHPNPAIRAALPPRNPQNLRLVSALPPHTFQELLAASKAVLTDSGGVSEEAAALGIPCVVARDVTDRPESVASGHALLAGRTPQGVFDGLSDALNGHLHTTPYLGYGDGHASERIVRLLTRSVQQERRIGV